MTPKLPVSRPAFVTLPTQRVPPVTPPSITPEVPRTKELLPPLEPITERVTTPRLTPSTQKASPPTVQQTASTQKQTTEPTTPRSLKLQPPFPDTSNIVNKKVPNTSDTCSNKNSCCEDESMAKLIIPIPIKSMQQTASSTCGTFAKLIIPLSLANSPTLSRLSSNMNELNTADLIKSILKLLG